MIVIALGANLTSPVGSPERTIHAALAMLGREGVAPVAVSPFYTSEAWPDPRDPAYINAVALVDTVLAPEPLMEKLLEVERRFGRVRDRPNSPRTLDIDLLDYNGLVRAGAPTLPHPRMHTRGFVLVPLADVAPQWRHPVSGNSIQELLSALSQRDCNIARLAST